MLKSKIFFRRFVILAILFNLPPILAPLFGFIGLEPALLIASLLLWVNAPIMVGLGALFDSTVITYGEFGVMQASPIVWLSILGFWLVIAGVLATISLMLSSKAAGSVVEGKN